MRKAAAVFIAVTLFSSPLAASSMSKNEAQIRQLLDRWVKAFRAKDVDAVMKSYASGSELVVYDAIPPTQIKSLAAYRKNFQDFFVLYDGPIDLELRDLKVVAGTDVGFIHVLERISGTQKGQKSTIWVRVTSGLRKMNGRWLIVHDHVSAPADFASGKAVFDLRE